MKFQKLIHLSHITHMPSLQIIDTTFQMSIIFQTPHTVRVKVYHEMHFGRTCGLCGTCNNERKDEFLLPNGKLVGRFQ